MPATEDFLTATLRHGNLRVDTTDTSQRPMIAILDAKPGLEAAFRERIVQLVRAVRREPGCVTFTAYEARDTPGRFYLYEVYTDAAAFATHLRTDHVHAFISAIPELSTGGPGSLIQLNELITGPAVTPALPPSHRLANGTLLRIVTIGTLFRLPSMPEQAG